MSRVEPMQPWETLPEPTRKQVLAVIEDNKVVTQMVDSILHVFRNSWEMGVMVAA